MKSLQHPWNDMFLMYMIKDSLKKKVQSIVQEIVDSFVQRKISQK